MADVLGQLCKPATVLGSSVATALILHRRRDDAAAFVLGPALAIGACNALKHVVDEHRPRLFDKHPEQSFPSSHTAGVAAYALTAIGAAGAWWALPLAVGAVAAIDRSRISQREHWMHDVLAGDLIGIGCVVATAAMIRFVRRRRERRATMHA